MKTTEERKEFALSQIAPYLKDPSTCGFNKSEGTCEYLDPNGNMCVAGKNMIKAEFGIYKDILDVLAENEEEQEGIFKPEVVGILTNQEWKHMQSIHDTIAVQPDNVDRLKERIKLLDLFTYEELVERAESLK
jgi:hypothetical protein